jgi:hypothetical protein
MIMKENYKDKVDTGREAEKTKERERILERKYGT